MCRDFQPNDLAILVNPVTIVEEVGRFAGSTDQPNRHFEVRPHVEVWPGRSEAEPWFRIRVEGGSGTIIVPAAQLRPAG